jgi:hypothetical protein
MWMGCPKKNIDDEAETLHDDVGARCEKATASNDAKQDMQEAVVTFDDADVNKFQVVGPLDDYLFRPPQYATYSVYQYTCSCFRAQRTKTTPDTRYFKQGHPLAASHCVGEHQFDRIPVLSAGFRIPFLGDCQTDDQQDYHAQTALLLFKPFATLEELCNLENAQSWHNAWLAFEPQMSLQSKRVYLYMQDYHIGRKLAAKTRLSTKDYANDMEQDNESNDGHDDDFDDLDMEELARASQHQHLCSSGVLSENEGDIATDDDGNWGGPEVITSDELNDPIRFPSTDQNSLDYDLNVLVENGAMTGAAAIASATYKDAVGGSNVDQRLASREQRITDIDQLRKWALPNNTTRKKQAMQFAQDDLSDHVDNDECDNTSVALQSSFFSETRVTLLDNALEPTRVIFKKRQKLRGTPPDELQQFPFIDDVSYAFGLKYRQHIAFVAIAKSLLRTWRSRVQDKRCEGQLLSKIIEQIDSQQRLLFLYGCGGTGKSHVIDAVEAFCNKWQAPGAIAKAAMTGKAAVGIAGITLHSWIGMHNLEPTTVHEESEACRKGVPGFTESLCLLVIDEISMMNKLQLVRLDASLKRVTKTELAFGGLHLVLAGDFFQMPNVGGSALYMQPNNQKIPVREHEHEGYHLWRLFKTVIELDENVRFESDPEWGKFLDLARKGIWMPEFMNIINERMIPPAGLLWARNEIQKAQSDVLSVLSGGRNSIGEPDGSNPVFVTPDNETRLKLTNTYSCSLADALPKGHYPLRIVARFGGALRGLSHQDINRIMSLPHGRTADLAAYIDLIPGMPVIFTLNVNAKLGIANGTFAHVHSVQFPPETLFRLVLDSGTGITVLVPNQSPTFVLVRVCRSVEFPIMPKLPGRWPDNLPDDIYPVFMMKAKRSVTLRITTSMTGEKRTVQIRPTQLPFVNAISSTVYKVQGETLTSLVVADWYAQSRPGHKKINQRQQAYIMLSRVVNRNAIATMKPFEVWHSKYFHPGAAILAEDEILKKLCHEYMKSDEVRSMFLPCDYIEPNETTTVQAPMHNPPTTTLASQKFNSATLLERVTAKTNINRICLGSSSSIKTNASASMHSPKATSASGDWNRSLPGDNTMNSRDTVDMTAIEDDVDPAAIETTITTPGELQKALDCLRDPCAWLNDCAIDFHLKMIIDNHAANNVRYLSSHFYTHLTTPSFCYSRIQNWMRRLAIPDNQESLPAMKVFIPVHCNGNH